MRNTWVIAKRQFASYWNGAAAYIVLSAVLLLVGGYFWHLFFLKGHATVRDLFGPLAMVLVFGAPALTMGLLAEEKRNGTIELLLTMPVKDWEVVVGKFLGVLGLYTVLLLLTLPYPVCVATLGQLDWGQALAGYLGIYLQGAAMLSIGLLASSFTDNQLIAFFVAAFILLVNLLAGFFLPIFPSSIASVVEWLTFTFHAETMARGVIDTRDLVFFLSLTGFALLLTFRSLESRRWK